MIFWLIVGLVLGYFFKPQIDKIVYKAIRKIRDRRNNSDF